MLVWYAAYGSNLLRERFVTYLRGGPVPVSGRVQRGARDRSDPLDDRPLRLGPELVFGHRSRSWGGGGVCFVDPLGPGPAPGVDEGSTLGRAWLITVEQLADVWAQENGVRLDAGSGPAVGPDIDIDKLRADGGQLQERGWYRRLHFLGELDGHPVATITCQEPPDRNPAGAAYLEVVARGVMETWALSPGEAARYLASRPGNAGRIDPIELTDLCRRSPLG